MSDRVEDRQGNFMLSLEELIANAMKKNSDYSEIVGEVYHNCTKFNKFSVSRHYGDGRDFLHADDAAFYVWTKEYIYFHQYYDGTSTVKSITRNPTKCIPEWIGGG